MTVRSKLLLAALTALIALAALAPIASALRGFSFGSQAFTGTDPALTFGSEGGNVICPVTLEGTLHRSIAKVDFTLAGFVQRGRVAERSCTDTVEGATVQTELGEARFPWHIRYRSFTGTLPNISRIEGTVVALIVLVLRSIFGTLRCRYAGTLAILLTVVEGLVTRISVTGTGATTDPPHCPPRISLAGLLAFTALLPVTLI